MAEDNLARVFGDRLRPRERRRIGHASFVSLGRLVVDFARLPRLRREWVEAHVEIAGIERLRQAQAAGRGVLQVGAHYGSWELIPHALAETGVVTSFVVRPANNEHVEAIIRRRRECSGNHAIVKKEALRECLERLRRGETVGMLIDQHVPAGQGVPIRFLGQRTHALAAPAALAIRTGATLLPVFIERIGNDRHRIQIGDAIPAAASGQHSRDVADTTARIHAVIAAQIERHPEPWLWIHRRFREDD